MSLLTDLCPDMGWGKRGEVDRDRQVLTPRRAAILSHTLSLRTYLFLILMQFWSLLGLPDSLWWLGLIGIVAMVAISVVDMDRYFSVNDHLRKAAFPSDSSTKDDFRDYGDAPVSEKSRITIPLVFFTVLMFAILYFATRDTLLIWSIIGDQMEKIAPYIKHFPFFLCFWLACAWTSGNKIQIALNSTDPRADMPVNTGWSIL